MNSQYFHDMLDKSWNEFRQKKFIETMSEKITKKHNSTGNKIKRLRKGKIE